MKETPDNSRRTFMKGAATAAAASTVFNPNILFAQGANNKLNIAAIGAGGKGASDINSASEGNNVVAICDVDSKRAAKSLKKFPNAKVFTDYRDMIDKMGKEIDAVTISTPDHTHFPAAMLCMEAGKHVCVQKPLANTIWEARQLLEASRKYKVVTQMGIQGHTNEGLRLLKEWIDADAIGQVQEIVYWTNRPIWPQGADLKFPEEPVPEGLNWDLWQGTVPERPYNSGICPFKWRGFWDYGCGALGDIGCHAMDAAFWTLDLGAPDSVEAHTTPFNEIQAPKTSHLTYMFPAKGNRGPVKVTWMDGDLLPSRPKEFSMTRRLNKQWGQFFIGDKGTIYVNDAYCASPRIIPEEKFQEFKRPDKTLERSPTPGNPQKEWTHCIKNDKTPGANFEYAAPLTEMVLAGNLAIRANRRIEWDSANMKVKGMPEADKFIKREYRKGWEPKAVS